MKWEPTDDDIAWTKNVVEALEVGQDWLEGEMAFRRTGEKTLTLISRTERAGEPAERVGIVLENMDWELDTSETKVIPNDPAAVMGNMQQEAQSWMCPSCSEVPIVNLPLEDAQWRVIITGEHGIEVAGAGNTEQEEQWVVVTPCPGCTADVLLSPMDYSLVAGEDLFYTWNAGDLTLRVLARDEVTQLVDADLLSPEDSVVLGSVYKDTVVPPHMRGTLCIAVSTTGEEE